MPYALCLIPFGDDPMVCNPHYQFRAHVLKRILSFYRLKVEG